MDAVARAGRFSTATGMLPNREAYINASLPSEHRWCSLSVDEVTGKVDGFRLAGIVEYRSSSPLAGSGN
jgi:hypothetical protein